MASRAGPVRRALLGVSFIGHHRDARDESRKINHGDVQNGVAIIMEKFCDRLRRMLASKNKEAKNLRFKRRQRPGHTEADDRVPEPGIDPDPGARADVPGTVVPGAAAQDARSRII